MIVYSRIALIGFRATGKTTLGRKLAERLNWQVWSTDRLVEEKADLSVSEIIRRFGWMKFRELEHSALREIVQQERIVIDCGGGIVENTRNMELLEVGTFIAWLDAPVETIQERIKNDSEDRPLLNQKNMEEDVQFNYVSRRPLYRSCSQIRIDTSTESVTSACDRIEALIGKHSSATGSRSV